MLLLRTHSLGLIAQLYTGDVGLKMERRSYQGSSGGFKRSARDLHHMTAPRKAAVELQLLEFFSLIALHLHPPSLPLSLSYYYSRMASRLVLVIGDLFIPDRAPVSGGFSCGLITLSLS